LYHILNYRLPEIKGKDTEVSELGDSETSLIAFCSRFQHAVH